MVPALPPSQVRTIAISSGVKSSPPQPSALVRP